MKVRGNHSIWSVLSPPFAGVAAAAALKQKRRSAAALPLIYRFEQLNKFPQTSIQIYILLNSYTL